MSFKEAYRRERRRIQRYISYRKGLGFLSDFELPKIPNRITEGSVRRLQKFTPKFLREKETKYVSRETGEITVSDEHYKLTKKYKSDVKKREKKKSDKTLKKNSPSRADIIIANFMSDVSEFPNSAYPIINKFMDELKKEYSNDEIAEMLEQQAINGKRLTWDIAYNAESLINWLDESFPGNRMLMDEMEDFVFENSFYEYEYG